MPATYVHPDGYKITFPPPRPSQLRRRTAAAVTCRLYRNSRGPTSALRCPGHVDPRVGCRAAEALRTEDGGLMIYTEDPDGAISFSELPRSWAEALVYGFKNYKVFIDGVRVWLLNPEGMQLEVPIRGLNVPET